MRKVLHIASAALLTACISKPPADPTTGIWDGSQPDGSPGSEAWGAEDITCMDHGDCNTGESCLNEVCQPAQCQGGLAESKAPIGTTYTFFADNVGSLLWMGAVILIAMPVLTLLWELTFHQGLMGNYPMAIRWQVHRYLLRQSIGNRFVKREAKEDGRRRGTSRGDIASSVPCDGPAGAWPPAAGPLCTANRITV